MAVPSQRKKEKDDFAAYLKEADAERARRAEERFKFQPKNSVTKVQQKSEAQQQASHSVDIEERLFMFGNKVALQCDNCCYLSPTGATSCQYCQGNKFCKIGLSDEYFKDIKGKYLRVGYAHQSLKAIPIN